MEKSVKESVVESYGKLAKSRKTGIVSKLFACCDQDENARQVGKAIGYSEEVLASVPTSSNLGVGCGNPIELATIKKGETVIDLGSGAGFDAFIVSQIVEEEGKVIGIDLSDEMLNLARENAQKNNYSNVEFIKGDIEKLPLDDNSAEHVISNCVINLSLNKGDVFKEAFRVLKDDGKISISDIVLVKELPNFITDSLSGHIACVSGTEKLEDYLRYVEDAGFKDIKIESKAAFPLELMLTDPEVMKLANEVDFKLDSQQAKDIAASVVSISLTARK